MASTTFIDGATVIYASWLNDVNNLTYLGTLPASDLTVSGTITVPVVKSSATTMTVGTVAGGGTLDLQSNGTTVATITSSGMNVAGTLTKNGINVIANDGGTYGISITGNAVTATNVSGGTVSATTGSFSSSLTVPNGQFATNAANLGQIPGYTNGWTSTSFALNTTYTNNTSRPLFVIFTVTALRSYINVLVAGVQIAQVQTNADPAGVLSYTPCMFVVPPNNTYEFTGTGNLAYTYTL